MNIKKLFLAAIAIVTLSISANAQGKQMKIAHINSAELMEGLPQVDTINMKLEKLQKEYQHMLDGIKNELAQKEAYWDANPTEDPDFILLRQKEYEELVQRYQSTEQEARQGISKKQAALYTPLFENLKKVIQEVAVELGYTYVLDSGEGGGMIYGDPSHDLMIAVKEKLKTAKL